MKRTVCCVHGGNEQNLPIVGKSVGWYRMMLCHALNFAPGASALLNGEEVDEQYILTGGEILEFLSPFGRKGVGDVFMPEDLIERFRMTREDYDDWVTEGLPIHKIRNGSVRITETQVDRFLDRRAGVPTADQSGADTRSSSPATCGSPQSFSREDQEAAVVPPRMLTPEQAAHYLQVSRRTLDRIRARGTKLGAVRIGGQLRFDRHVLDAYLKKHADK